MKPTSKWYLLILVFAFQYTELKASSSSIQIENQREYEVLDHFFKMGISEEGYDYVLEGIKPISIRNFYSLDDFPVARDLDQSEKEFINTLLVREAIPIWNKLCSVQKKFVLKAVPLNNSKPLETGWEVSFINLPKLQKVIEKNIDLFRYALNPLLQPKQLAERLAYSNELLSDILCNDSTLIGIVLGFGSHNSILGGRADRIDSSAFSRDIAPFSSKSYAIRDLKEYYGLYFIDLAGDCNSLDCFKGDSIPLNPSTGFPSLKEEALAIEATQEPLPPCLREKPAFIFGAYKGELSNQLLFNQLKQTQKKTQKLLKKSDFCEVVLKKIGGKSPRTACKKPLSSTLTLSFFRERLDTQTWLYILDKAALHFESPKLKLAFINSLSTPSSFESELTFMMGASEATLKGLKKACQNLSFANTYFKTLSKEASIQPIIPDLLYYKKLCEGFGKELKGPARIRISYTITDSKENLLFAHHDNWISLSKTIPGFAHGLQGMKIGEKRELFIHPSLAYGELTTLPCS